MRRSLVFGLAALVAVAVVTASMNAGEKKAELSKTDRLLAQAQKICPISGKDLDSMGGAIKAVSGERTIFLCCKGCFGKKINNEHWARVNANLKAAQKSCPVRNVALGDEAVPVVVQKRAVFVCCDSGYCIRQVKADPDKYVAAVDQLLEKNLKAGEDERK